jgi:hypothetical protein
VHPDGEWTGFNPPTVSSSDEFKDPFSEDTGGGFAAREGGAEHTRRQDAKEEMD